MHIGQYISLILLTLVINFPTNVSSTKHTFTTRDDGRFLIGPIGKPYGFLGKGFFKLSVYDYKLIENRSAYGNKRKKDASDNGNTEGMEKEEKHFYTGFLLKRVASESEFAKYEEEILEDPNICSFQSYLDVNDEDYIDDALLGDDEAFVEMDRGNPSGHAGVDGVFMSMRDEKRKWGKSGKDGNPVPSMEHTFEASEAGLYVLLYQVCAKSNVPPFTEVRSSFELDISMHNFDTLGKISYLTAGEMPLPSIFLYFSMSYLICLLFWAKYLQDITTGKIQSTRSGHAVHQIHHMMTLLLVFKTLTVFFESVRYHYIRTTGHAELWSVVYFGFSFLKGIMLFIVILLIGSGWSFLKPFLNMKEKRLIFFVLILQIIDNIAVVILANETEGERPYEEWSALLHLVDILCCCAVLLPIVWQVNSLEQVTPENSNTETTSNNAASSHTLSRLKLFRSFYILVVSYIYFTRVVVYLFATILSYRITWLRHFTTEIGTLAFYVVVGYKFRPEVENPYMQLLKKDDEFVDDDDENNNNVEMGNTENEPIVRNI